MTILRRLLPTTLGRLRASSGMQSGIAAASEDRPRILTDVSVIIRHDAQTGIQRVVRAVYDNLLQRSGSTFNVVPVYASRTHGYRYAPRDFLSLPLAERLQGKPVRAIAGDRFLGLDLSAHLLPAYKRQLSAWRAEGVTTHLVVYDLLPLLRPDWFTEKAVRHFNRWLEVVRNHCDDALCISDQVAGDLREYLSAAVALPRIRRLKLAGDLDGSYPSRGMDAPTSQAVAYAQRHPAVLMVGTIEPRKGYDLALAAFEHLWKESAESAPALIIAGKPGWRTEALQERLRSHPEAGRRLFWLSGVSDEGLGELYEASRGVLLTSHAEGFGLPAIEAAMRGKHTLVRDLPVFREQELPNLHYFAEDDARSLATMIADLAARTDAAPIPKNLPTWKNCVDGLLVEMGLPPANQGQLDCDLRRAS